jgi:hypothetical protein
MAVLKLTEAVSQWFAQEWNSKNWAGNSENASLLRGDSEEEGNVFVSHIQCVVSLKYLQELVRRHWYCWTLQMTDLQFQRNYLYSKLSFALHFTFFVNFLLVWLYFFLFLSKIIFWNLPHHFNVVFVAKSVSTWGSVILCNRLPVSEPPAA